MTHLIRVLAQHHIEFVLPVGNSFLAQNILLHVVFVSYYNSLKL